ncbi:MAG: tetratricopeptide repeat protein [Gammaproteobacteria bacterium]|nr:tetratricopeptide repeat protein [Gammaproteobacteria bacterium]
MMDTKTAVGQLSVASLLATAESLSLEADRQLIINLYLIWLEQNPAHTQAYAVYYNLGVAYAAQSDVLRAIHYYRLCLSIKPDLHEARLNLGSSYERLGQLQQALEHWRVVLEATKLSTDNETALNFRVMALNNLGRVLESQKSYHLAESYYEESLELRPDQPNVIQHWGYVRQRQCAWPVHAGLSHIPANIKLANAGQLALLALTDNPISQLRAAHELLQTRFPQNNIQPLCRFEDRYEHDKVRLAFTSSDIANHPVALLTVPLFELIDRSKFELYLFSWGHKDESPVRKRILSAVDQHYEIDDWSDDIAANKIRELEIDILIDFNGLTAGARPQLYYYRPAPIQLTYLGFPGPYGHPCIDYVLADKHLLPEKLVPYFPEQALYLPRVFQLSDDRRIVGVLPARTEYGLPEEAVVFGVFNNNYKITPELFVSWITILKAVPNSVLWLLADNPTAQENMETMADYHNLDVNRLIFAGRVSQPDYLARFALVDLYLDTFPFNAGTTANDVLFMGTPIVTIMGESFASRMAGSLLIALGLDKLIAYDVDSYTRKAIELGNNPHLLVRLRQQILEQKAAKGSIFDSQQQVNDIENLLLTVLHP